MPRRVDIEKKDYEEHGYTSRCPGCSAMLKGKTRQRHNEACRNRMEEMLKDTEKMKKWKRTTDEVLGKMVENADDEQKKKKARMEKKDDEDMAENEGRIRSENEEKMKTRKRGRRDEEEVNRRWARARG